MSPKLILVRVLAVMALVLGVGCSHRRDSGTKTKDAGAELRIVVVPLEKAEAVLEEDARNFSAYLTGFLAANKFFRVNTSRNAVTDFSRKLLFENSDELRRAADKHLVEGVVTGRIHDFEYGLNRRNFFLRVDVSLTGRNTYTGETFLNLRKNVEKRFRVRRGRKQDFSEYNRKALDELLGDFQTEFLHKLNTLIIAQKSRHKGVLPTRRIASVSGSLHSTGAEVMQILLWPVKSSGKPLDLPVPIRRGPDLAGELGKSTSLSKFLERSKKKKYADPKALVSRGKLPEVLPEKKRVKPKSTRVETPVLKEVEPGSSDSGFNLAIPGFHLVYPRELIESKKYQKFYYLVETAGSGGKSAVDLEDAGEETLILEIFSTVDRKAVGRFLEDYFRGLKPNPMGQMPTVFERDYMGKYQVGFPLENRALIASGHRSHRDSILNGVSTLFVRNGGVSVARILKHSFKKGLNGTNIVLKDLSSSLNRKLKAPGVSSSTGKAKRRAKQVAKKKRPATPTKKLKKRAPVKTRKAKKARRIAKKSRVSAAKKSSKSSRTRPPDHKTRKYPANAVFFFDMGKGYYKSGDYDTALHYFELAYRNGYDIPELQEYLERSELGKRKYGKSGLSSNESEGLPEFLGPALEYETYDYSRLERQARTRVPSASARRTSRTPPPPQPESSRPKPRAQSVQVQPVKPAPTRTPRASKPPAKSSNLEEFYREMQKMEQDIERYMKQKKNFRRQR